MITTELVHEFITLVDEVHQHVPVDCNLPVMLEFAGLLPDPEWCQPPSRNLLFTVISEAIVAAPNELGSFSLKDLRRALLRHSVFYGSADIYSGISATILFGVNEAAFVPLAFRERWIKAIRLAFVIRVLPSYPDLPDIGLERDRSVAGAAVRLRDLGYRIRLDGKEFRFEDGELDRCCSDMDRKVTVYGGAKLAAHLLGGILRPQFARGRYSLGRRAQTVPIPGQGPAVPFGYLLNLAVKHVSFSEPLLAGRRRVGELIQHAGDIVALLDLEPYSTFEVMYPGHGGLPDYLQDIALGDFCLSFRQLRVPDAIFMIKHLFDWVDLQQMEEALGWTTENALDLATAVLTNVSPDAVNVVFKKSDLVSLFGGPSNVLDRMLPYFTHDSRQVNFSVLHPFDAAAANFDSKPFIWCPGDRHFLLSPVIGALGFYEALASALRTVRPLAVDTEIGSAVEGMLADAFRVKGIQPSVVSGKYLIGSKRYEFDLVLEGPEVLILLEVKKKALTSHARAGDALMALKDLVLAMISAQTQLSVHEKHLRTKDQIVCQDGTIIRHNGRKIERVAVSLFDWGGFQDRLLSDNILKILATSQVGTSVPSPEVDPILDQIRDSLTRFQIQQQALGDHKAASPVPFFDCLFLSVPLILYILDGVQTVEEFHSRLCTQKAVGTGAADPYLTDHKFRDRRVCGSILLTDGRLP